MGSLVMDLDHDEDDDDDSYSNKIIKRQTTSIQKLGKPFRNSG